ncbi:MAG TPA: Rieske 2Fe-2S domain-containing protein [Dehalococcoidia bacterium]|nr:Rieske 2Fe-2S domain-containing protein [Dehalococcoidia bacterium]
MLSKQDNELLCRVGPGTPMGELMRQYWLPAMRSDELPAPDCPPLRVKLLGEELIGFRTTSGKVGLIQNACPHRGASLFFGRNEEEGLRCVYHGWKFDVEGRCVDMPSEPAESNFKNKVRARAYPCVERNGIVWAYMGPREVPPPLPQLEANMVEGSTVNTVLRDCNWMQALEGDIDTVHFVFLHYGHLKLEDTYEGGFFNIQVKHRAAGYSVVDTEFGACYGAYRPAEPDTYYWRVANWLFPFYTQVPPGTLAVKRHFRAWVPMDDHHTLFFGVTAPSDPVEDDPEAQKRPFKRVQEMLPDTTDWYGRSRPKAQASNDYLLDREFQMSGESYTGLPSVFLEDQAITESMGPIYERSQEHLGTSDSMIIRVRRSLIKAAVALRDHGVVPPGVDNPEVYGQRSGGVILPRHVDWFEATRELRKAFVKHTPEEVQASLGRKPKQSLPAAT